jgi:hypothetical protein
MDENMEYPHTLENGYDKDVREFGNGDTHCSACTDTAAAILITSNSQF